MANNENRQDNPHPGRASGGVIAGESDLVSERKKTLRDYLAQTTAGTNAEYGPGAANQFPIDPSENTISTSPNPDTGSPPPLEDLLQNSENQEAFLRTLEDGSIKIFNEISSGAFFERGGASMEAIAGTAEDRTGAPLNEANMKNEQTFGHGAGSEARQKAISSQVSATLLNNRFSPPGTTPVVLNPDDPMSTTEKTAGKILRRGSSFPVQNNQRSDKELYFGADRERTRYQSLGAEAVLAGSGYVGAKPKSGKEEGADWDKIFEAFDIENIQAKAAESAGVLHGGDEAKLRGGTTRISSVATTPTPDWLSPDRGVDIDINYVDAAGEPSSEFGNDEEYFSYTVMNNMIDGFTPNRQSNGGFFSNDQYVKSLTFMGAIFLENILTAVFFDVILLLEIASFDPTRSNLFEQYENKPGVQLRRGGARGTFIPFSEFDNDGGFITESLDILDLLGIPNPADLLSGAFLADFIFRFMGVQKPIQSKTNLVVFKLHVGSVISFVPAYTVGALHTTISVAKDPMAAGFMFNLARQVARKGALAAGSSINFTEAFAGDFFKFFMDLRQNAAFRFFVTMTNLGDVAIGQFYMQRKHEANAVTRLTRTKAKWGERRISPASVGAVPSLFIIPKSFRDFRKEIGRSDPASQFSTTSEGTDDQFHLMADGSARIPQETVEKVEKAIDADYMPFYIKDMRTNEIIGFHAFLNSLSDGFSATYGEARGLGRIEPAYTYESSARSIGLSFTMMAFSPEDMDMLYWKLNKLVTLCYPQWSRGTKLKGKDAAGKEKEFFMPFSQIPTASPLVRMRVGDIITSNFSSANAARMLGVGANDKKPILDEKPPEPGPAFVLPLGSEDDPKAIKLQARMQAAYVNSLVPDVPKSTFLGPTALQIATSNDAGFNVGDIVRLATTEHGSATVKINKGNSAKVDMPSTLFSPAAVKKNAGFFVPDSIEIPIAADGTQDTFKIIGIEGRELTKTTNGEKTTESAPVLFDSLHFWLVPEVPAPPDKPDTEGRKKTLAYYDKCGNAAGKMCFAVHHSAIKGRTGGAGRTQESIDFVQNNTVTKAFYSNPGAGMAGFIDNLQIDWQLNNIMWGTDAGKKAPQGCVITLGFKPIHDITPGIDADGLNRAPVYKVGGISNQLNDAGVLVPPKRKEDGT